MSKKALGKGIDALLSLHGDDGTDPQKGQELEVSIEKLIPNPDQPRKAFHDDALRELADSIQEQGIIQPIIVEEGQDGSYLIVAGERRYRASKMAGLEKVPVLVRSFTREQKLEIALIENIQREDLNPIEEAQAYKQLMDSHELSQDALAKRIGKKRSTVANALRLLKMSDEMQQALVDGSITAGHARAILSVVNPADQMILFSRILNDGLSVRNAEVMSFELNKGQRGEKHKAEKLSKKLDPEIQQIEQKLIDILGTKVQLKGSLKTGKIEISYYSMDDLERVFDLLQGR